MTHAGLNYLDLNYGPDRRVLNKGLFSEWHRKVGNDVAFSIDRTVNVFNEMNSSEENLTVYKNINLKSLIVEKGKIKKLSIIHNQKEKIIIPDFIQVWRYMDKP